MGRGWSCEGLVLRGVGVGRGWSWEGLVWGDEEFTWLLMFPFFVFVLWLWSSYIWRFFLPRSVLSHAATTCMVRCFPFPRIVYLVVASVIIMQTLRLLCSIPCVMSVSVVRCVAHFTIPQKWLWWIYGDYIYLVEVNIISTVLWKARDYTSGSFSNFLLARHCPQNLQLL